ncbi:MAG: hypothetical protein DMF95_28545 [Acidobacteria bacterium]|nr:MAG: hypothetical protein DMF95_28545 [Acidobacteriota bacterium]
MVVSLCALPSARLINVCFATIVLMPRSFSRPPFAAITRSSSAAAFALSSGGGSCAGRLASGACR